MEQTVFNAEVFTKTLETLQALGQAHEPKNEEALRLHNKAFHEFGGKVSSQMPDVSDVDNYSEVGKAIVEFISTIPGVSTEGMLEVVSNPNSIALSDRGLSARLRREGKAEVGVYLSFSEWKGGRELYFDRTDINNNLLKIELKIGSNGMPIDGKIEVGKRDGQFVTVRDTLEFDLEGGVINDYSKYNLRKGEHLNIIKMIQKITTPNKMDEPMDINEMIREITLPKIEGDVV